MDAVTQLMSQYSIESLIILIITLAVAFKFINELWEWCYNKMQTHFNYKSIKNQKYDEIIESINSLKHEISNLSDCVNSQSERIKKIQAHEKLTLERLQENSRSYIIDKHHYFCYEIKAIDDLNMQSLERRYMYYKTAGGNSFIDGLMDEIRDLPRINLSNHIQCQPYIATEEGGKDECGKN